MRLNLILNNVCYFSAMNIYKGIIKPVDEAAIAAIGEESSKKIEIIGGIKI